jgi:hypothetical protein
VLRRRHDISRSIVPWRKYSQRARCPRRQGHGLVVRPTAIPPERTVGVTGSHSDR